MPHTSQMTLVEIYCPCFEVVGTNLNRCNAILWPLCNYRNQRFFMKSDRSFLSLSFCLPKMIALLISLSLFTKSVSIPLSLSFSLQSGSLPLSLSIFNYIVNIFKSVRNSYMVSFNREMKPQNSATL